MHRGVHHRVHAVGRRMRNNPFIYRSSAVQLRPETLELLFFSPQASGLRLFSAHLVGYKQKSVAFELLPTVHLHYLKLEKLEKPCPLCL